MEICDDEELVISPGPCGGKDVPGPGTGLTSRPGIPGSSPSPGRAPVAANCDKTTERISLCSGTGWLGPQAGGELPRCLCSQHAVRIF